MRVVGYTRVSTEEQGRSGAGLQAQRDAIQAEADRRGWEVEWIADDGHSAKSLRRPGIERALGSLRDGEAEAVVVAKLDRLSRSVHDCTGLMQEALNQGWALVCLSPQVDMTTAYGRAMAQMAAVFAELERELISERTREALAVKREQGVRLGRPRSVPADVRRRIVRERAKGLAFLKIATGLNRDGVPTGQTGSRWHASTVRAILLQEA